MCTHDVSKHYSKGVGRRDFWDICDPSFQTQTFHTSVLTAAIIIVL